MKIIKKTIKVIAWIAGATILIVYCSGCENNLGANATLDTAISSTLENNALDDTTNVLFGGTSCAYSGSGDWYINSSDSCVISTDTYVNGSVHLLNTGSGRLYIIDGATLACENINSTSTNVDVEAGSKIKLWNDS